MPSKNPSLSNVYKVLRSSKMSEVRRKGEEGVLCGHDSAIAGRPYAECRHHHTNKVNAGAICCNITNTGTNKARYTHYGAPVRSRAMRRVHRCI